VYQEAEWRAATDDAFVFLGGVFDSVNEPVYIDKWMHLASLGNELVARSVADYVEGSLQDRPSFPNRTWISMRWVIIGSFAAWLSSRG
jgi:hypothetical protein